MAPKRKAAAAAADAAATAEKEKEQAACTGGSGLVDPRRRRLLTTSVPANREGVQGKAVVYWMSRDQRVDHNWAFLHALDLAKASGGRLIVVFCLVPKFLDATLRHFDFMLKGLREVEAELSRLSVPFKLLPCKYGEHAPTLSGFCKRHDVGTVVCDMSPLRVPRAWTQEVASALEAEKICCVQVDAHNIVPVWQASNKQETAARTIRSKITTQYGEFLVPFPAVEKVVAEWAKAFSSSSSNAPPAASGKQDGEEKDSAAELEAALKKPTDWDAVEASLEIDRTVKPVSGFQPGAAAARKQLSGFLKDRLEIFADKRNDPNVNACSGLSPYLHFGQISAHHCALEAKAAAAGKSALSKGLESYLEESIVRRELSDNFCWYQDKYDSLEGAAGWAQETLAVHSSDKREHIYSEEQLELGKTHDDLWNAAQLQMVTEGKMHGFLRMYWAKKILEWTPKPAEALRIAVRLNDRYELDGRDPNGYVGIMWSIAGIHDMGWTERDIFGKIRFMNYAGCKRKFNVPGFVSRYLPESATSLEPAKKRGKKS